VPHAAQRTSGPPLGCSGAYPIGARFPPPVEVVFTVRD
jgi:hypothetical protein